MAKATSPGITSWLFYVTAAIITAMVASSFGGYASSVLTDNDPTWAKAFSVAIVLVMAALNVVGSTAVAKVQSIIVKIVLTILTLFAVVTLLNLDPTFLTPSGYPGVREIIASVALTFFAFLGFGVITFTAKDLPDPAKQLPKGFRRSTGSGRRDDFVRRPTGQATVGDFCTCFGGAGRG